MVEFGRCKGWGGFHTLIQGGLCWIVDYIAHLTWRNLSTLPYTFESKYGVMGLLLCVDYRLLVLQVTMSSHPCRSGQSSRVGASNTRKRASNIPQVPHAPKKRGQQIRFGAKAVNKEGKWWYQSQTSPSMLNHCRMSIPNSEQVHTATVGFLVPRTPDLQSQSSSGVLCQYEQGTTSPVSHRLRNGGKHFSTYY